MRKATPEKKRTILANANRRSRRELAEMTGLSLGTVQAVIGEAVAKGRSRRPAPAPVVAPAPAPVAERTPAPDAHDLALHAYARSADAKEAYGHALTLARLARPDFARWLDEGLSVPSALSGDDPVVADLYATAEGLAHLATHAADDDKGGAAALLKEALEIVEKTPCPLR